MVSWVQCLVNSGDKELFCLMCYTKMMNVLYFGGHDLLGLLFGLLPFLNIGTSHACSAKTGSHRVCNSGPEEQGALWAHAVQQCHWVCDGGPPMHALQSTVLFWWLVRVSMCWVRLVRYTSCLFIVVVFIIFSDWLVCRWCTHQLHSIRLALVRGRSTLCPQPMWSMITTSSR